MNFASIQIPKICLCREIGCMRTFLKGHSNCCYTYDIGLASYVRAWLSRIMCKLLHSLRFYCCKVRLHCLKNVAMKCWDFIPESRYAESIFSFNLIKVDTWKLKASELEEILNSVSLRLSLSSDFWIYFYWLSQLRQPSQRKMIQSSAPLWLIFFMRPYKKGQCSEW